MQKGKTMTETIIWKTTAEELPDDEIAVLIRSVERDDVSTEIGYLDGGDWRLANGAIVDVVFWSHLPTGPKEVACAD